MLLIREVMIIIGKCIFVIFEGIEDGIRLLKLIGFLGDLVLMECLLEKRFYL